MQGEGGKWKGVLVCKQVSSTYIDKSCLWRNDAALLAAVPGTFRSQVCCIFHVLGITIKPRQTEEHTHAHIYRETIQQLRHHQPARTAPASVSSPHYRHACRPLDASSSDSWCVCACLCVCVFMCIHVCVCVRVFHVSIFHKKHNFSHEIVLIFHDALSGIEFVLRWKLWQEECC